MRWLHLLTNFRDLFQEQALNALFGPELTLHVVVLVGRDLVLLKNLRPLEVTLR